VSQPFDRGAVCPAPAELDEELDEFWSGSAWRISSNHNLSGYERNRTYLNNGNGDFVDISHVTGTDSDGDGRSSVAVDLNHDGRLELVVRQVGGGPLKIFNNNFPQKQWIQVSLRGKESNRQGIGARLVAEVGNRQIVREIFPANSYLSQSPATAHFGLGSNDKVDTLTIRWPNGKEQIVKDISTNQHLIIREGDSKLESITPGKPYPF